MFDGQLRHFLYSRHALLSFLLAVTLVVTVLSLLLMNRYSFTNGLSVREIFRADESRRAVATASETSPADGLPAHFFGLTVLDYQHIKAALPFGITRTWDAYPGLDWAEANPAPAKYEFRPLDKYLSMYGEGGREVIYTFGRTPRWASTKPDQKGAYSEGECGAPNLDAWDAYVRAIVQHAAGRIHYWELWNEPDQPRFYCGDIPQLVSMAQHAYTIIKRLDPSAVVLSPAMTGGAGAGVLAAFIAGGGRGTFDVVAFHGYEGTNAEAIIPIVAVYRHALTSYKLDLPVIDTECSWGQSPIGNDAHRAAFLAKYFILQWSVKVSRVLWYAYDSEPEWGRLIDSQNRLLPDGVAYAETYKWLVGAALQSACAADSAGTWMCQVTRPEGYRALIIWNSNATNDVGYHVPGWAVEYRDLSGHVTSVANGTVLIGNNPILVESKPLPV
jgi:polysaccharide biosynthesis protein PslG